VAYTYFSTIVFNKNVCLIVENMAIWTLSIYWIVKKSWGPHPGHALGWA